MALPFIAAPALANQSMGDRTLIDRTAWDRARYHYERSLAALERAGMRCADALDAFRADRPSKPPLAYDLTCTDGTTARGWFVDEAELRDATRGRCYGQWAEQEAEARARLIPLWDAYHAETQAASNRHGVDRLERAHDRAETAYVKACREMLATPSPDAAALAYKLTAIWGEDCEEGNPSVDLKRLVAADAVRLAGKEARNG